ncbi:S8 family serine peptidase [Alkalihalobacillus sp. AL-G]|uniref:S8 family peptidase n=1 Tax=Alkalihalobacillus sp. AL-G TaxID=2926399 RepID=UPI0027298839|nr:S8 family serine peptidase [Alkalihalobacillus sp. AL-G]WLD94099.1 S8 family serine peptidase [Alkalihalobacillus sp. AL-G]
MKRIFATLLSLSLLVGLFFASQTPNRVQASALEVDETLTDILSISDKDSIIEAVVTYSQMPTDQQVQELNEFGIRTKTYKHLPMIAVKGTKLEIDALLQSGLEALSIYYNKDLEYFLRDSRKLVGAEKVWNDLGYTGKGTTVAVIDSGIDATHPDLPMGEKVVQNVKFLLGNLFTDEPLYMENVVNTDTSSGHGTHVAGTIAGQGTASDGLYKGIAPDAKLVGLGTGEGINILWSLEAFDYVLENQEKYGIDVISNSWGTTGEYSPNNPINVASKKAHDAGMVVTFAAGNAGPDDNTLNPYSAAPWVISVAAGTKDKQLADFSSRGIPGDELVHPDITAPGVDIVATKSSTGVVMNSLGSTTDAIYIAPEHLPYYTTASGTSMATPHISGIVALMRESQPGLHPDIVLDILQKTADPMEGYEVHEVGSGYVNAYEAVQLAERTKPNLGKYKDKETGKTYETFFVEQTWDGSIGVGASEAGAASHDYYNIELGRDAVSLTVRIDWTSPTNDLDLEVRDPSGDLAGSSGSAVSTTEQTTISTVTEGTYAVDVVGWLNTVEQYTGTYIVEKILK